MRLESSRSARLGSQRAGIIPSQCPGHEQSPPVGVGVVVVVEVLVGSVGASPLSPIFERREFMRSLPMDLSFPKFEM